MSGIPIYRAEIDAGLAHLVSVATSLAHAAPVKAWDAKLTGEERAGAVARLRASAGVKQAKAALDDFDLYYLQTVLATTGWNKNDDVFDPLEVWTARHTPAHKPFNYEHDCAHIIGHIITNWAMGDDGKALAEDVAADDLPVKFHVATGGVLYKCWEKPELQERMDAVLAEIGEGKWFVSMDCMFKGFDYALQAADGTSRVVARNEKTAFLTKHLRAYGGAGQFDGQRVGRLLRNFVFSGKGLVRNPANPESVILTDTEPFAASKAAILTEVDHSLAGKAWACASANPIVNPLRVELAKARLGMEQEDAEVFADCLASFSDDKFLWNLGTCAKALRRLNPVVRRQELTGPAFPAHDFENVGRDIAAYFDGFPTPGN